MAYVLAKSLQEIERTLVQGGEELLVMGGGTDLMVRAREAVARREVLDVTRVPDLRRIEQFNGTLRIGAAVTYEELRASPLIREHCPVLVQVSDRFASPQIRNVATVGGNVANASPAGDALAALWALEARVHALMPTGTVEFPIHEVVVGPGKLGLPRSSVITEFAVELPEGATGASFYKLVNRAYPEHPMAISVVSVTAIVGLASSRRIRWARIVLGAVASTPVRARQAEASLADQAISDSLLLQAATAAVEAASPIDDIRATRAYRLAVIPELTRKVLSDAIARARRASLGRLSRRSH